MYATQAKASTSTFRDTVIETKLIPIGDKPRNNPISPVKPKLNATDSTNFSIMSTLFLPRNRTLTKQYPGRKTIKIKPRT
jgi:hypothetical protein